MNTVNCKIVTNYMITFQVTDQAVKAQRNALDAVNMHMEQLKRAMKVSRTYCPRSFKILENNENLKSVFQYMGTLEN